MIEAGKCKVAVLFDGWPSHSLGAQTGSQGFTEFEEWPPLRQNMEVPWGLTVVSYYALAKMRHMYQYGSTDAQFANVSVVTRAHAVRNRTQCGR
jgi:acetyl-CoA C-acetyltransferase